MSILVNKKYLSPVIVAVIVAITLALLGNIHNNFVYVISVNFVYALFFSFANFKYFDLINHYIGWNKHPKKKFWLVLTGTIPLNFMVFYVLNFLFSYFVNNKSLISSLKINNIKSYVFVILLSLFITFFYLIINFIRIVSEIKVKNQLLKTETEKIKFNSLKNQLDPHFLFNSLNVLVSLIDENPEKAENFTLNLSDIYRYVLDTEQDVLVDLKKEIEFAQKYLYLLKMRFENNLHFKLPSKNIPLNKKIPPLSLQILLENVIKHNEANNNNPLNINICVKDDFLQVENNLNKRKTKEKSTKIGLKNLIKRYSLITDKKVIIQESKQLFIVKIPLI